MNAGNSAGNMLRSVFDRHATTRLRDAGAPLNSLVYQAIREALLLGMLEPGETLSYRAVAASLGVSSMPVREALGKLTNDGALESLPNRAFCVPLTSPRQFRELLLMRLRLETLAAEQAAIKAQPAQLLSLAKAFETLRQNERSHANVTGYLAAHHCFHFEIYRLSDMPRLYNAIETLWLRVGPLFKGVRQILNYQEENQHHADMLRAMEICDPKAIVTAIEDDITLAGRRTMQLLEKDEDTSLK